MRTGRASIVKLVLDHGGVDVNGNAPNHSPLLIAAGQGNEEIVDLLLSCETIEPDVKDSRGGTPLIYAAEAGHTRIVELLLDHGGVGFL